MLVKKDAPGSAAHPVHGSVVWRKAGEVLEVAEQFGRELIAIPGAGFSEVAPHEAPKAAKAKVATPVAE